MKVHKIYLFTTQWNADMLHSLVKHLSVTLFCSRWSKILTPKGWTTYLRYLTHLQQVVYGKESTFSTKSYLHSFQCNHMWKVSALILDQQFGNGTVIWSEVGEVNTIVFHPEATLSCYKLYPTTILVLTQCSHKIRASSPLFISF